MSRTSSNQILNIAQDLSVLKELIDLIRPYTGCQIIFMFLDRVYPPMCEDFL